MVRSFQESDSAQEENTGKEEGSALEKFRFSNLLRPRWRKVFADLWGNKARTLLVVASIAVGVFAIGVIAGAYVILAEDLDRSYTAANPANIELITTPFESDLVDVVRRVAGVGEAEGYRQFQVRVRVGPETWDEMVVKAFDESEPQNIFRLLRPQGTLRPDEQEIVLEEQTLETLGLEIGDAVQIELPDGARRALTVVGAGLDQSDIYNLITGQYRGYVAVDTLPWLHQPPQLDRLRVTVAGDPHDKAHINAVATAVNDRVEAAGRYVYGSTTAAAEHPISGIIEALLAVLIILGVLIVFLSGSLIANTMSALLSQHLRQIGIMKLVGARRFQVIGMYMLMIASFGVIAVIIAVPLGSWGAYALASFAAGIVHFVLQDFQILPQAVFFQVLIGLVVPPLAGLWPVLKGSRTTVRKALTSTGLGGGSRQQGWLDRQLHRFQTLSRPLLISIRNTFRRKGRLALTLFTLTLGGAIFIAVFNTQVAMDARMAQVAQYFGADVQLEFAQPYRIEEVTRQALRVPGVADVEVWLTTGAELIHADGSPSDALGLIAPPAESALIEPTLLAGRWLLPGDERAIAVNEAFWDEYPDLQPGDVLRLNVGGREEDWTIVGVFQYTGFEELVAYANYAPVARAVRAGQRASSYRIVTEAHDLAFQQEAAARLDAHFRAQGFKIQKTEAGKAFTSSVTELLGIVTIVLLVMAGMTALVGSIGLTGTMSMNVMERTREIGVMRAIGAHNQIVSRLVIVEGLIIGLISYVVGALLSFPISALLSNVISLAIFNTPAPFAFTAQGFIIWLVIVIVLSVVASLMPARNASRLTIREVLAYE